MSPIRLLLILLVFALLTSCKSTYDEEMPADFSFKIASPLGISFTDSYDSSTAQFVKKYLAGDTLVHAPLSMETKRAIYQAFCEADVMSIPDEFLGNPLAGMTLPNFPTLLTVTYRGKVKKYMALINAAASFINGSNSNDLKT